MYVQLKLPERKIDNIMMNICRKNKKQFITDYFVQLSGYPNTHKQMTEIRSIEIVY